MNDPTGSATRRLRLEAGRQLAHLDVADLWLDYVGLGGNADQVEVEAHLLGLLALGDREEDVLAHAVNERLLIRAVPAVVPYARTPGVGAVDDLDALLTAIRQPPPGGLAAAWGAEEAAMGLDVLLRRGAAARAPRPGGAWADVIRGASGSLQLTVGNVSGGSPTLEQDANRIRAVLRAVAHTLAPGPALTLQTLDRVLHEVRTQVLATTLIAEVGPPPDARRPRYLLRWSSAGHPPPLVVRPTGGSGMLARPADAPLGLHPDVERTQHELSLLPGSTVVLFAYDLAHHAGTALERALARLVASADTYAGAAPAELCDALMNELVDEIGEGARPDLAVIALRIPE